MAGTGSDEQVAVTPGDVDFDAFYRGEAPVEGTPLGLGIVPWDIGEAQPRLVELERAGGIRDEVLDIGCGPGDNARFLASRGYRVTGVDGSETAIAQARRRASDAGVDAEFQVGDATELAGLEQRYRTIVDSALYHCLEQPQRAAYAAATHRVALPGAQLHLYCFSDAVPGSMPGLAAISIPDLRANLGEHWEIRSVELASYTTAFTREVMEQQGEQLAAMGMGLDFESTGFDERGRLLIPVWHLHAERR